MNGVFATVLAVDISLRGVDRVIGGIQNVIKTLGAADEEVKAVMSSLKGLSVDFGIITAALKEEATIERYKALYKGLTGSMREAYDQLDLVNRRSTDGVFNRRELLDAVHTMDKWGVSVKNNMDLALELGARAGNMHLGAQLVGMIEAGNTERLGYHFRMFGIGHDELTQHGVRMQGMAIKSSPQEVMRALREIVQSESVYSSLMQTVGAKWVQFVFQVQRLAESIGRPLAAPIGVLLGVLTQVLSVMVNLNNWTGGWLSSFLVLSSIVMNAVKLWGAMKLVFEYTRLSALWAQIYELTAVFKSVIVALGILSSLWEILTWKERIAVFWAIIYDALVGNWAAIAVAFGVAAAAVGIGGHFIDQAMKPKLDSGQPAGQRPQRNDDLERLHQRLYGNFATG